MLAGGESSRMGRDKALLPFHGGVLAGHVAATVAAAAGSAILIGNPEKYGHLGYPVIPDRSPGAVRRGTRLVERPPGVNRHDASCFAFCE